QDTSAPVPAAGPEVTQIQSSGISAESISESQSEDIGETESTTDNSFALDPFETSSGTEVSSGGGITSNELLSETSDDTPISEPVSDSGEIAPPPPDEPSPAAPVIILPDAPTITEDTPIVLNGFNIQDSSGSTLNVEITAQSTVTLASTAGLTFLEGDGVNDETLIFEGSADDINNALNGMVYNPTADNDVVGGIDIIVSNGSTQSSESLTVIIEGVNDAPVAVDDTDSVVEGNSLNSIAVLDNDSDVDGDTLTVTGATAANGSVSINADNTLNYTPDEGFTGTDTIIYTISDGADPEPLTDTASVEVEVTPDTSNVNPVAGDDTAATNEDTTLNSINVLSNDTDANEDPLTVTGASALNGIAVVNSDGTINYTPNADFHGIDTIIYDISDGNGGTDTGAVTVTVDPVNDAPVANDDTAETDEDTPLNNIDLLANDEDVDGDQLSIIEASAEFGDVAVNNDGTINYTPLEGFNGTDTVTYTIHDGNDATDTGTLIVTVNPVNNPPVADDEEVSTDEDTPIEAIDVLTGDTDSDGDQLTVTSATSSQGDVTINTDGTLRFDPAG
ncbi:MAG: Ig-like domain-containing protein, partial [Planctomycetota bacterium]